MDESDIDGWQRRGVVIGAAFGSVTVRMPGCMPGSVIAVQTRSGAALIQVRAVESDVAQCAPLDSRAEFCPGDRASSVGARMGAFVGDALLGESVDGWGRADSTCARRAHVVRMEHTPPSPADRGHIRRPMRTGVAAIDAFATIGFGPRLALFSGAGVGKSAIVRRIVTSAPVHARVLALVGERGREARETIDALRSSASWATTSVV